MIKQAVVIVSVVLAVSGCAKMTVKSTDGIKEMLNIRAEAAYLHAMAQTKEGNGSTLARSYGAACVINNGWLDGIKFDLQAKDVFDIQVQHYSDTAPQKAAREFITQATEAMAASSPTIKSMTVTPEDQQQVMAQFTTEMNNIIGAEAGAFAMKIVDGIIAANDKKVTEARTRIGKALDDAKWKCD